MLLCETAAVDQDTFPQLSARTLNFQLGLPRAFQVSADGARVAFLRTDDGTSRSHSLWVFDVASGAEHRVADPAALLGGSGEQLTDEERARRERLRVSTSGVVAFSADDRAERVAFALSSRLFVADVVGEPSVRELATTAPVIDPHIDPTGRRIAYAGARGLHVVDVDSGADTLLVGPEDGDPTEVVWGLAEFVATEELDRGRGFWWAPDGQSLLVERYDESPVPVWYISDPANPDRVPDARRYPQAGTNNAIVSLAIVDLEGKRLDVGWASDKPLDKKVLEYLAEVSWDSGDPVLTLLTRDQRVMQFRQVDPATGSTQLIEERTDDRWVDLMPGTPRRLDDGQLLTGIDAGDVRRLAIGDEPFTPDDLLVRSVDAVDRDSVIATVAPQLGSVALARLGFDGSVELLSDPVGVAAGAFGGGTLVVAQRTVDEPVVSTSVVVDGATVGVLESTAERSPLVPQVETMRVGARDYPTAVLFPTGHQAGSGPLPVLMDPYGGPHGQRVVNSSFAYLTSQWFADQGFVVIVADGRGMAGRGPAWDRLAYHDFVGTIDDQAEVLAAVAERYPGELDLDRVAIRGWSFGGYIAALGVLKRPEVFAAAVSGAPVTDLRLYDTCYQERYLGHPDHEPDVYDANSLTSMAAGLSRPLMLIHGLADDNVVVAHTLRLSSALLGAGRPHEVLPLSGLTHMANSATVTQNLLHLQVDFLRRALKIQ